MKWKDFKKALLQQGPSYPSYNVHEGWFQPRRGDNFERWLKWQRDSCESYPREWDILDGLLDDYRLHCDTGTPLNEHACDYACTCEGKEELRWQPGE